jgi:hypothetical protein
MSSVELLKPYSIWIRYINEEALTYNSEPNAQLYNSTLST